MKTMKEVENNENNAMQQSLNRRTLVIYTWIICEHSIGYISKSPRTGDKKTTELDNLGHIVSLRSTSYG